MGLDNGIMLKIKDEKKFGTNRVPFLPRANWEDECNYDWEILYWRKCWNIREVIFDFLHNSGIKIVDDCSKDMVMSLDVFDKLCYKLIDCYTIEWWDEHNNSIWTAEDMEEGYYRERLLDAAKLIGWLKDKDPDSYEIYFYDSY